MRHSAPNLVQLGGSRTPEGGSTTALEPCGKTWLIAGLAVLLLLLTVSPILAADCTSQTTGPWSDPNTWATCSGGAPAATDTATILAGHAVTLDADADVLAVTVQAGAGLDITGRALRLAGAGAPLTVESGAFFTTTGSTVVYNGATAQSVAAANVTYASLTIDNAAGVTLTAAITIPVTLALAAGALDNSAAALTLGDGAAIVRSGGQLAAAPIFAGQVDLLYTGAISVTSGPELPAPILTSTLRNLTVSDASAVTLGAMARVNGDLAVTGASALAVKNNGLLQVYGDAAVGGNGTLTASAGMTLSTSLLYFYGPTFTNQGTVKVNTIFDAAGAQTLAGAGVWSGDYLAIGQANKPTVRLANPVTLTVTALQLLCLAQPCPPQPTLDLNGYALTFGGGGFGTLLNGGMITGTAGSVVRTQGIVLVNQGDASNAIFAVPLEIGTGSVATALGAFSKTITVDTAGALAVELALTAAADFIVNTAGIVTIGDLGTLDLWGNLTNNGYFTSTGQTILDGPAAQTISGLIPASFYTLTVNNPAGVTLNAGTPLNGLTVNSLLELQAGAFNVGSNKTLTLKGAVAASGGSLTSATNGTVKYDQGSDGQAVLAANYGKLTFGDFAKVLPDGGTVRIAGIFTPGAAGAHTVTGSTIEYNGSAAQTAPAGFPAYHNLTINNTHTNGVTLGGATTVYGTLSLAIGKFTNGSYLTLADGAGIVRNKGSLTTAPTFAGQADLSYVGSTATAPGFELPAAASVLRHLTINNTIAAGISFTTDLTVNGNLTIAPSSRMTPRNSGLLTVKGAFTNSGAFNANNGSVFFAGSAAQNVTANVLTSFYNLTVNPGATLVEIVAADNVTVTRTLTNTGVIRKTQAVAGTGPLSFGLTGVRATITATGALNAVQVDRVDTDSPTATAGVRTGRHWLISANEAASGFGASLTLPHAGVADPTACRWNGDFWDCARASFTSSAVTRTGVVAFSDWAVGSSIAPATTPTLTISLAAPDVLLAWPPHNAANVEGYRVWYSADPYFLPGASGAISVTVAAPTTENTHAGAGGGPAHSACYVVQGRNAAGAPSGPSNRTAVFTFELTPGTP